MRIYNKLYKTKHYGIMLNIPKLLKAACYAEIFTLR